jgi:hypothetical protein
VINVQDRPRRANVIFAAEYIPMCPAHGIDMIEYSRRQLLIYFRCARKDCECTDKAPRKLFIASPHGRP